MPAAPFKVKAVYDYKSAEPDDLNFPNGQVITVTAEEDDDWYAGAYVDGTGKKLEGIFPKNFVEKYEPEIPLRPSRPARAKKDADPTPAVPHTPGEDFQAPGKGQEPVPVIREAEVAPQFSAKDTQHEQVDPPAPMQANQGYCRWMVLVMMNARFIDQLWMMKKSELRIKRSLIREIPYAGAPVIGLINLTTLEILPTSKC